MRNGSAGPGGMTQHRIRDLADGKACRRTCLQCLPHPSAWGIVTRTRHMLLCQLRLLVTGRQRRTRGIPSPIHEMISRWISLLPPPKVKMTAER
ncbi:hypothetical protein QFZ43_000525 [Streptomyces afghaniensis]|nr:hypothetical protein [Streptomyces afghaniensis]